MVGAVAASLAGDNPHQFFAAKKRRNTHRVGAYIGTVCFVNCCSGDAFTLRGSCYIHQLEAPLGGVAEFKKAKGENKYTYTKKNKEGTKIRAEWSVAFNGEEERWEISR